MSRRETILWVTVIATAFLVCDSLSIHTGDDLGYMFADSAHHSGDGARVTSLGQCLATQCSHYMTTNGRFAVHTVVMALLNLVPLWVFRLLNSLVFAGLWLTTVKLSVPPTLPAGTQRAAGALAMLLLFTCLPQPALLLFTLVSYAVNYVWVGLAVVLLLYGLKEKGARWWMVALAFATATLQESFSLPLCAGLLTATLPGRVKPVVAIAFIAGTAVEVIAPGNMAHAGQSGGFTAAAIVARTAALCKDIFLTSVPYSIAALGVLTWTKRVKAREFLIENTGNLVLWTSTAASLALAALTFTSLRQLTCGSLFLIILVLRAVVPLLGERRWGWTFGVCAGLTAVFLGLVGALRVHVYQKWESVLESAAQNRAIAHPAESVSMKMAMDVDGGFRLAGIVPDALASRGLAGPGDRYTKSGLSRLRKWKDASAPELTTLLPYSPHQIATAAMPSRITGQREETVEVTTSQVGLYSVVSLTDEVYYRLGKPKPAMAFEMFRTRGNHYIVVRGEHPVLKLAAKGKKRLPDR